MNKRNHPCLSSSFDKLCAIPMLNQVMGATRGATDILHSAGRHANSSLRKLGVKNLEAGIGCGLGFGHGFGVGLAVKPRVMQQIQSSCIQAVTKLMMKCGIVPNLSLDQGLTSLQSGIPHIAQSPIDGILRLGTKEADQVSRVFQQDGKSLSSGESSMPDSSYGTRTEKVLNSFLQNPLFGEERGKGKDQIGHLQSENNILHMVLKHQKIIDELTDENERIRRILVEDLKIPPTKLEDGRHLIKTKSTCDECFECRRKQRLK
ncbi:uncharacterized protein LOC124941721 isoform X2 [Impatiens glandulifera]|uniref:uncharacterized protein LOC124941721 isoform X2 n=1 Tax=Impatiens glandulifera TaxID=253017 RepID=UPI001FB076F7|nr:uncharacterized protein LOC124941721 isoform X2 [Impatiens glandulifera]